MISRTLHRLVLASALPLVVAPQPSGAAPVRSARSHTAVHKRAVAASNAIIPLPLNPVVPAGQRVCTAKTPQGLGYTMLRAASGAKPGENDTVLINYIGYLAASGTVFDQAMRTPLDVGQVIPGFSQGLQMMSKGAIVRLCVPAAMGYGARASGPIPANSDLVFQIELVDFRTPAEIDAMRKEQAADEASPGDAAPKAQ